MKLIIFTSLFLQLIGTAQAKLQHLEQFVTCAGKTLSGELLSGVVLVENWKSTKKIKDALIVIAVGDEPERRTYETSPAKVSILEREEYPSVYENKFEAKFQVSDEDPSWVAFQRDGKPFAKDVICSFKPK